jgi:nitronate monooxygenase
LPPFAVNLIVHASNNRLDADLAVLAKHRVPIVITSLGARADVFAAVRDWGGFAFHDVVNQRFAHKAVEKGAQGLILVAAGAGGHAGTQSPFALAAETRRWFDGPLALAGAISSGRAIRAARMLGADFAYIGSPFIPTNEALASPGHKAMVAECHAGDIVYTDAFSGVHGNYLVPSIRKAGLDPMALPTAGAMSFRSDGNAGLSERKVWKDIWGSGQGIGAIDEVVPAGQLVDRLAREYREAV